MLIDYGAIEDGSLAQPPRTLPRVWTIGDMLLGIAATTVGAALLIVLFSGILAALDAREGRVESIVTALGAALLEAMLGLWVAVRRGVRGLTWAALGFVAP